MKDPMDTYVMYLFVLLIISPYAQSQAFSYRLIYYKDSDNYSYQIQNCKVPILTIFSLRISSLSLFLSKDKTSLLLMPYRNLQDYAQSLVPVDPFYYYIYCYSLFRFQPLPFSSSISLAFYYTLSQIFRQQSLPFYHFTVLSRISTATLSYFFCNSQIFTFLWVFFVLIYDLDLLVVLFLGCGWSLMLMM